MNAHEDQADVDNAEHDKQRRSQAGAAQRPERLGDDGHHDGLDPVKGAAEGG